MWLRELTYREFSGVDAIEVVVAHGADVDRAAELPDEQPLVEVLIKEGVDLKGYPVTLMPPKKCYSNQMYLGPVSSHNEFADPLVPGRRG